MPQEKPRRDAAERPAADKPPVVYRPIPVTALHPGSRTGHTQRLAWPTISAKLAADPSLRYTEGGRVFLRWMAGHCMQADYWEEFIDVVPQHWLRDVSQIAASMSEEWRQFAERLTNKLETAS